MPAYLISYDLGQPGRNYDGLTSAIKTYGAWAHVTESTWVVVGDTTALHVRDHLAQYLDRNDRLFVLRSGTEAAWSNVLCKNEWLKKNL